MDNFHTIINLLEYCHVANFNGLIGHDITYSGDEDGDLSILPVKFYVIEFKVSVFILNITFSNS